MDPGRWRLYLLTDYRPSDTATTVTSPTTYVEGDRAIVGLLASVVKFEVECLALGENVSGGAYGQQ